MARLTSANQDALGGWPPSSATSGLGSVLRRSRRNSSQPPGKQASRLMPGMGLWLSLCLIHCRSRWFTGGHRSAVRAGQEYWRTVVNGGAQYSKACEGASLPWVQIPPPPPLTCTNTNLGRRQGGVSASLGSFSWLSDESRAVPPPESAAAVVPGHGRLGPA